MFADHWPLANLRLKTPDLELRWPTLEELGALADVAAEGVHEPGVMPFVVAWTDGTPAERGRSVIQHFWRQAGQWKPEDWSLPFVVFRGDQPMGIQVIGGKDFAITREVGTGSWLGLAYHGHGYGTQMRVAVLEFAFTGLGAQSAVSTAAMDNHASLGVSRKLGYRDDGTGTYVVQGKARRDQRLRLERAAWRSPHPVHIEGLVLKEFGL